MWRVFAEPVTYYFYYLYKIFQCVATICFNESSIQVNENDGSLTAALTISGSSSTDDIITVITTNDTANGKYELWLCI